MAREYGNTFLQLIRFDCGGTCHDYLVRTRERTLTIEENGFLGSAATLIACSCKQEGWHTHIDSATRISSVCIGTLVDDSLEATREFIYRKPAREMLEKVMTEGLEENETLEEVATRVLEVAGHFKAKILNSLSD